MKSFLNIASFYIAILYLEIVFKIISQISIDFGSLFIIAINCLFLCFLFSFILSLFPKKIGKIIYFLLIFIISIYFCSEFLVHQMFGFYYDFGILDQAKQITAFLYDTFVLIKNNILYLFILFIPLLVELFLCRQLDFTFPQLKTKILFLMISVLSFLCMYAYSCLNSQEVNSLFSLAFQTKNVDLCVPRLGVLPSFETDIYKQIIHLENSVDIVIEQPNEETIVDDNNLQNEYNILDIDFDELISNEEDETLLKLHQYFHSLSGSKKNDYTGIFEDKNLIVIVAESFSKLSVKQDLTPTLYRLINEGSFSFENYYSTSMYSTVGGELQFNTSLYPLSGLTDIWKSGSNYWPMGIGNVFKNLGYQTYAYHDNTYNYLDRDQYIASIGFDNYLGCYNGMEEKMNCNPWTESDIEMIESTVEDYIDDEHFMVYYTTVSGHGLYTYDSSVNVMGSKYRDFIESCGYEYSEEVTAYLSGMIELDKAVECLLDKLSEANRLEDTVLVLLADHYPYYLEQEQINELANKEIEPYIESNENNLIIYNPSVEGITIDKVASTIDVLPTIYNLFGIDYDSRLLIGTDILSESECYAIFGNNSWVSNFGTYYAADNRFVENNSNIDDSYFETTNKIINNKINVSLLLAQTDYFSKVWPKYIGN